MVSFDSDLGGIMSFIRWGIKLSGLAAVSLSVAGMALAGNDAGEGFFNNADGSPIVKLIDGAQRSVSIEIYEMDDPGVIGALRNAARRGVAVHIVKEPAPLGDACRVFDGTSALFAKQPVKTPRHHRNSPVWPGFPVWPASPSWPSYPAYPATPSSPSEPGHVGQGGQGDQGVPHDDGGGWGGQGDQPHHAAGAVSCADQQRFVQEVNSSRGGRYVPFRKETLCPRGKGCFEHGKIAVIDGELAMITSGNFNVSNLCDRAASPAQCDRDYSFVTRDRDVVDVLSRVVEADIAGQSYDVRQLLPGPVAEKLTVGPNSLSPLVAFVQSARTSLQIENQYMKDDNLNSAVMDAARRGVKVQIMVADGCGFGALKPAEVKRLTEIFSSFDAAGVTTRVFTKNIHVGGYKGYLHAKAIVADGNRAWMGSVNGSVEALSENREFGVFFDGATDVSSLRSVLSSDFADAGSETWQDSLRCTQ